MKAVTLLALGGALLALPGCGGAHPQLDAGRLGLPSSSTAHVLASTTLTTTPDGGIYKNPDHVEVLLVTRHDVAAVEAALGTDAADWARLAPFGDFTVVALTLRNDGKAGSDPQLNQLQLASDYAPAGTQSGPLRRFYHPTWPLALLSPASPGDGCSLHVDPGHSVTAILVYPPDDIPQRVVWGAYGSFALTVPTGGSLPPLDGSLDVVACTPPPASATAPS